MKKSATAGTHFNARVVECRLAAKVCFYCNKHCYQNLNRAYGYEEERCCEF